MHHLFCTLAVPTTPAWVNLTHVVLSDMLKWLRGGCSVHFKLALYHPPNPSPTPSAHRHTLWVCVDLSVCYVHVFKCTVSVSTCTQGGLLVKNTNWLAVFLYPCMLVYSAL